MSSSYLSEIEKEILRSSEPIKLTEKDEINVFGETGLWANKLEVLNWKSDLPIESYKLNEDHNPEIIIKQLKDSIEYIHEIAIRYLKPPSPLYYGEIIINQEPNKLAPPAPPLIIRQQPPRTETPEPIIIREAPPPPPDNCRKVITVSGKQLPPPPRKVVIERLPKLPAKPQPVVLERWLPYTQRKRKVIYQGPPAEPVLCKPRNVIVQWEAPEVSIKKRVTYLGVTTVDPEEYRCKYGDSLKKTSDLPADVLDIKYPAELMEEMKQSCMLEGDLEALKLIDLEKEGLSSYRDYLIQLGIIASDNKSESNRKSKVSTTRITPPTSPTTVLNLTKSEIVAASTAAVSPILNRKSEVSTATLNRKSQVSMKTAEPSSPVNISPFVSRANSFQAEESLYSISSKSASSNYDTKSVFSISSKSGFSAPLKVKSPLNENKEWTGSFEGSEEFLRKIFNFMDCDYDGQVKLDEIIRTLEVLNKKFNRNYAELSAMAFLTTFDRKKDGYIDFDEFKESIREILKLK